MNDTERELYEAVRSYGDAVQPGDRLGAIRRATIAPPARGWHPWVLAGGAAVVAASVVMGTLLLTDTAGTSTTVDTPVAAQTPVTVYTMRQPVGENYWLFPEQFHTADSGEPVADAVGALIADTDAGQEDDRWIGCPWGHLDAVVVAADAVTVTLAGMQAICDTEPAAEQAQLQQLAWTVRDAVGADLPVVLARNGQPVVPQPISPDPAALSPVIIDAPNDGSTVSSPVELRGTSDTFEANVPWQVLQDDVVAHGVTMGGSYGKRGPWRDTVDLTPGEYTLRVWADSAEDGSLFAEDTVAFTVE